MHIHELDTVALLQTLPDYGLQAGEEGAVVLVHKGGEAYEVEFVRESDDLPDVLITLPPHQLRLVSRHNTAATA